MTLQDVVASAARYWLPSLLWVAPPYLVRWAARSTTDYDGPEVTGKDASGLVVTVRLPSEESETDIQIADAVAQLWLLFGPLGYVVGRPLCEAYGPTWVSVGLTVFATFVVAFFVRRWLNASEGPIARSVGALFSLALFLAHANVILLLAVVLLFPGWDLQLLWTAARW